MRGLSPTSYTIFLALIALVVAAGTILIYRLRRDVDEDICPVTDEELLREFEQAYVSGEMDEAEFRSVTEALRAKGLGAPRLRGGRTEGEPDILESDPEDHPEGSQARAEAEDEAG